ncbi:MAG: recombinase family protein [Candidatus Brocadiia bacterium]
MVNSPEPEIQNQGKISDYQQGKMPVVKKVELRKGSAEAERAKVIGLDAWLDRIQAGKRRAASQGRHQGGVTPYGYRKNFDPIQGRFVLRPEVFESSIVRMVYREYLRLRSLGKVARRMNEMNIPSPSGAVWSRQALGFMLSNPVYLGRVTYGQIQANGGHEAIIAPIVFNMVQKIKGGNKRSG